MGQRPAGFLYGSDQFGITAPFPRVTAPVMAVTRSTETRNYSPAVGR
jgi:hypothetical protein